MRRLTTFGKLPSGARFRYPVDWADGVKGTDFMSLDTPVIWPDAPDDAPAAAPEPPAAVADEVARLREALRQIAEMPTVRVMGYTEARRVAREALGEEGETT